MSMCHQMIIDRFGVRFSSETNSIRHLDGWKVSWRCSLMLTLGSEIQKPRSGMLGPRRSQLSGL